MDFTTIVGLLAAAAGIGLGIWTGEITSVFLQAHGIGVVLGGTLIALAINTPAHYAWASFKAMFSLFAESSYADTDAIVKALVGMSERAQKGGVAVLRDPPAGVGGGFLQRACDLALAHNDPAYVRKVLTDEINSRADYQNELVNVYRTGGLLFPMFGLIGTLLGIVKVLRELSNPEQVGPAMGVAITSAFYGILLSNLVCVPVAGKLRVRLWEEVRAKGLILEGVCEIMKGGIPAALETRLEAMITEEAPAAEA